MPVFDGSNKYRDAIIGKNGLNFLRIFGCDMAKLRYRGACRSLKLLKNPEPASRDFLYVGIYIYSM